MNIDKLKQAQKTFLSRYPKGFQSEEMIAISKKHKLDKIAQFVSENLAPDALDDTDTASENMIKIVSRSSMVSVFEKPKFRDAVRSMPNEDKQMLVDSLKELLYGEEAKGFNMMLDLLIKYGIAKWPLISVFRCYYNPHTDLLLKPTTVKNVIKFFELEGLVYKPRPSYDFYVKYRNAINVMKSKVDASLAPNNPAFSGFLMMAMDMLQNDDI